MLLPTNVTIDRGNLIRGVKKLGRKSSQRRSDAPQYTLCISGDDAAEVYSPEEHRHAETNVTKAIARHTKIRDQNPSLGYICPGEPHERSPNAPKFEDRSQEETCSGKSKVPAKQRGSWPKVCQRKRSMKEQHSSHLRKMRCLPASTLKPEERELVVDSGASTQCDPGVSVQKTKLHKKPREACKSSWNPKGSLKSFTLTIPWNSVKLVKITSWNHCTSTPHLSETNGIAERAVSAE